VLVGWRVWLHGYVLPLHLVLDLDVRQHRGLQVEADPLGHLAGLLETVTVLKELHFLNACLPLRPDRLNRYTLLISQHQISRLFHRGLLATYHLIAD
jgi:hypothetical protein